VGIRDGFDHFTIKVFKHFTSNVRLCNSGIEANTIDNSLADDVPGYMRAHAFVGDGFEGGVDLVLERRARGFAELLAEAAS